METESLLKKHSPKKRGALKFIVALLVASTATSLMANKVTLMAGYTLIKPGPPIGVTTPAHCQKVLIWKNGPRVSCGSLGKVRALLK